MDEQEIVIPLNVPVEYIPHLDTMLDVSDTDLLPLLKLVGFHSVRHFEIACRMAALAAPPARNARFPIMVSTKFERMTEADVVALDKKVRPLVLLQGFNSVAHFLRKCKGAFAQKSYTLRAANERLDAAKIAMRVAE